MQIKNDTANRKFTASVDGGEAKIRYRRGPDNAYELVATEVPEEARGKNIADQLVREALRVAKEEDVQVIATCPYVKRWFEKHPEEQGILMKSEKRAQL
ncbi:hypothetical protein D3C87_103910 [compost metagenome]